MTDRMQETKPGFRPHREDFQADWTKNIPEHWEVRRLKFVAKTIAGQSPPSEIVSAFTGRYPFLQGNAEFGATSPSPRLSCEKPNKSAEPGDILLSVRAPVGAMNIADQIYGIGRGLCAIRANTDIYQEFLYHTLTTTKETLKGASTGSTYDAVSIGDVASISTPVPPPEEQAAIVRFLDDADQRIRAYVSAKERLIALLEEERQALVHQAVTRGLDPNVKLKSSGVEWLGDVPEHWELRRIRNLGQAIIGLTYSPQDIVNKDEGKLVLRASNISGGRIVDADNVYVRSPVPDKLVLREGDILICSRSGSRNLIGKNARIESTMLGATFGAFMTILRGRNNDYLHQVFNSKLFEYQSGAFLTSTINQLTLGILNDMKIPFPPAGEQRSILQHLKQATKTVDVTIDRSRRQTALMKEYRTRLIADVVTGQLDVREAAEELPTPEPTEITD